MRRIILTLLLPIFISGCAGVPKPADLFYIESQIPTITGVGFAVVSSQPGRIPAQKGLMAMRASKMAAMRDLAEQVHGLKIEGNTTVVDMMVQNDTFRSQVKGTIRNARTVRISPTGEDTYETVLELDSKSVWDLLKRARSSRGLRS